MIAPFSYFVLSPLIGRLGHKIDLDGAFLYIIHLFDKIEMAALEKPSITKFASSTGCAF